MLCRRPAALYLVLLCVLAIDAAYAQDPPDETEAQQTEQAQEAQQQAEDAAESARQATEAAQEQIDEQQQRSEAQAEQIATQVDEIEALTARVAELEQQNTALLSRLSAQSDSSADQAQNIDELLRTVTEQRRQIADQLEHLDEQQAHMAAQDTTVTHLQARIEQLDQMTLSLNNRMLEVIDQLPDSTLQAAWDARLDRLETSVEAIPELPEEVVGAGDFLGSLRIPGTDAQIKISGQVRTNLVANLDALNVDDRFLTAAIPMEGTTEAGKGPRLTITARYSRFSLDLRTPSGVGRLRAFIEGDFAGASNAYRLRHAFGQYRKILVGQTWSTLVDLKSIPEELDFEGLNAKVLLRHAQIRGTYSIWQHTLAVGIENPSPEITNGSGVGVVPDLVVRTDWETFFGHLQTSAVLRGLRAESDSTAQETDVVYGWGLNVGGNASMPWLAQQDDLRFQLNFGEGYGHYINDLKSEGGQDAVLDTTTNELVVLPAFSAYVAYAHWWKAETWRSTFCYGYVYVWNQDFQTDDSYTRTDRFSINVIFSPVSRMDVGAEFLWGRRKNKDGQQGTAQQIQIAWFFRF